MFFFIAMSIAVEAVARMVVYMTVWAVPVLSMCFASQFQASRVQKYQELFH